MITADHILELGKVSGNFWETYLDPSSRLVFQHLRDTLGASGFDAQIQSIAASYDGRTSVTGPRLIPFPSDYIIRIGAALNNFRSEGGVSIDLFDGQPSPPLEFESGAEVGRPAVSPPAGQQGISYLTPLPANCVPLVLLGRKFLLAGVDFRVIGGFIETFEAPQNLFHLEGIVVWKEERLSRNPASYSFGVDGVRLASVSRYYRYNQTPSAFFRAACEAVGLWEVEEDCVILARGNSCYVTDQGRIPIRYKHAYHQAGDKLVKGQFIGAAPVFTDLSNPYFAAGLLLNELTPFNVTVPAGVIRVDVRGEALLPKVEGHPDEVARYHEFISNNAAAWGATPATSLGYADLSVQYLDWLARINEELLGSGVWVVDLAAEGLDLRLQAKMRRWMSANRPLGRAMVFASEEPPSELLADYNGYLLSQPSSDYFTSAEAADLEASVSILPPGLGLGYSVQLPDGTEAYLIGGNQVLIPFHHVGDGVPDAEALEEFDWGNDPEAGFFPTFLHNIFVLPHLP